MTLPAGYTPRRFGPAVSPGIQPVQPTVQQQQLPATPAVPSQHIINISKKGTLNQLAAPFTPAAPLHSLGSFGVPHNLSSAGAAQSMGSVSGGSHSMPGSASGLSHSMGSTVPHLPGSSLSHSMPSTAGPHNQIPSSSGLSHSLPSAAGPASSFMSATQVIKLQITDQPIVPSGKN